MSTKERLVLKRLKEIFKTNVHDDTPSGKMSTGKRLREKLNL